MDGTTAQRFEVGVYEAVVTRVRYVVEASGEDEAGDTVSEVSVRQGEVRHCMVIDDRP